MLFLGLRAASPTSVENLAPVTTQLRLIVAGRMRQPLADVIRQPAEGQLIQLRHTAGLGGDASPISAKNPTT